MAKMSKERYAEVCASQAVVFPCSCNDPLCSTGKVVVMNGLVIEVEGDDEITSGVMASESGIELEYLAVNCLAVAFRNDPTGKSLEVALANFPGLVREEIERLKADAKS